VAQTTPAARSAITISVLVVVLVVLVVLVAAAADGATHARFRFYHGQPLPDAASTPGATLRVSASTVCRAGYAGHVRNVSDATKRRVYAEYAVTRHRSGEYEVDHLVPLELGGSNAIRNLWPERNDHPRGYLNSKDRLENRLHSVVCAGRSTLAAARQAIATNWVLAYRRTFGAWPSAHSAQPPATGAPSSGVRIISVTDPIRRGAYEHLVARSARHRDACRLAVTLPSGRNSTAAGLGAATADGAGGVSWAWRIGTSTTPGRAAADVTCSAGVAHTAFTITA
jgi:hypothetical protein